MGITFLQHIGVREPLMVLQKAENLEPAQKMGGFQLELNTLKFRLTKQN